MRQFCIYGAGIVATGIYTALKAAYNCIPLAFLVSDSLGNPSMIDGISVIRLSEWNTTDSDIAYLIAAPETHHSEIRDLLYGKGIEEKQIVPIDYRLENKIMGDFYRQQSLFMTIPQLLDEDRPSIEVFQAKCHTDKDLSGSYDLPKYICPIQVGAALVDYEASGMRDNVGDNISAKNGNYCELTASYFAWKNSGADYKGLCHYRRIFDLSDMQMQKLLVQKEEWDVLLPYPSVHYPDISMQHVRYVNDGDWKAMIQALKETAPEYYDEFPRIFRGQFFYNFNMLIAKREIFDDYCKFIFSVLGRAEELTVPKGWERADRFAGYLGENLTTLYFMVHQDRMKIAHIGKLLLT